MKRIARETHNLLLKNSKTVATAESCTGGLLAKMLTDLSCSSKFFILGVITYSNSAKKNILKIPGTKIAKYGAVSEQIARLMAKQIRIIAKSDLGIGITGIAGPTGGSLSKPVGTVFIAIDQKNRTLCKKFNFKGRRAIIRQAAAFKALELLRSQCELSSP